MLARGRAGGVPDHDGLAQDGYIRCAHGAARGLAGRRSGRGRPGAGPAPRGGRAGDVGQTGRAPGAPQGAGTSE